MTITVTFRTKRHLWLPRRAPFNTLVTTMTNSTSDPQALPIAKAYLEKFGCWDVVIEQQ